VGMMQGQDVLTCPNSANNHQKTSICEVFLLDTIGNQLVRGEDFSPQE
jgi:hypothetical protein